MDKESFKNLHPEWLGRDSDTHDSASDYTHDSSSDRTHSSVSDNSHDSEINQTNDNSSDRTHSSVSDNSHDSEINQTNDNSSDRTHSSVSDNSHDSEINQTHDSSSDHSHDTSSDRTHISATDYTQSNASQDTSSDSTRTNDSCLIRYGLADGTQDSEINIIYTRDDLRYFTPPSADAITDALVSDTNHTTMTATDQTPVTHQEYSDKSDSMTQSLPDEINRLKELLQQEKTYRLRDQQEHLTAIRVKREEIDKLQEDHSELTMILNERIVQLQTEVRDRNIIERERDRLALNYDACLDKLLTVEKERDVLVHARDSLFAERQLLEREISKQNNELAWLRQRLDHVNTSLIVLTSEYRAELKKAPSIAPRIDIGQNSFGLANGPPSLNVDSTQYSEPSLGAGDHRSPFGDGQTGLRLKLYDASLTSPFRIKRFKIEPSNVQQCLNCGAVFDGNRASLTECRFHASVPQPYQVWRTMLEGSTGHHEDKFWPCCGRVSRHEPPGCKSLRRHVFVCPLETGD